MEQLPLNCSSCLEVLGFCMVASSPIQGLHGLHASTVVTTIEMLLVSQGWKAATLNLQCMCWCRFVGGLSGLHTYFTSRNKSTYEHFRSRAGSHENPYDVNCIRNWEQVLPVPPVVQGTTIYYHTCRHLSCWFGQAAWSWE